MEPVNNSNFQVLNCPANSCNICGETKRECYDAKFCPIKQQVISNWVLQSVAKHYLEGGVLNNIAFIDIPKHNLNLLQPYPHRIVRLEDLEKVEKINIEFEE